MLVDELAEEMAENQRLATEVKDALPGSAMRSDVRSVTIDEAVELIIDHRGRTPKKLGGDFSFDGIQVVSAKHVYRGRLHLDENRRFVPLEMAKRWMPTKLLAGDVLLTSEAPLGEAAYLNENTDLCLGQRLFALRARPTVAHHRFLYYALRSPLVQRRLHARATGTTAQGIKQSELRQLSLSCRPPLSRVVLLLYSARLMTRSIATSACATPRTR